MAAKGAAKTQALYDVHPSVAMVKKCIAELKEKTGRSLGEWTALIKKEGSEDEMNQREWLIVEVQVGGEQRGVASGAGCRSG